MPTQALDVSSELTKQLNSLDRTRSKIESLARKKSLVRRDVEQVYSGLFLEAVTSFERHIERLFMGLLVGAVSTNNSAAMPRVTIGSHKVAHEVLKGSQRYIDWLPFSHTEKRAEAFFRGGRPFTQLTNQDKKQLEHLMWVRNAIAHKSGHAQRVFQQKVIAGAPISQREKTPAGYLRSVFRTAPTQTQYEALIGDMVAVSKRLCS